MKEIKTCKRCEETKKRLEALARMDVRIAELLRQREAKIKTIPEKPKL